MSYAVQMKFRGFDNPVKEFDSAKVTFWEQFPKIPGLEKDKLYWVDCISMYSSKDVHEPSNDGDLPTGNVYPYGDTSTDGFIVDLIYFDIVESINYDCVIAEDC